MNHKFNSIHRTQLVLNRRWFSSWTTIITIEQRTACSTLAKMCNNALLNVSRLGGWFIWLFALRRWNRNQTWISEWISVCYRAHPFYLSPHTHTHARSTVCVPWTFLNKLDFSFHKTHRARDNCDNRIIIFFHSVSYSLICSFVAFNIRVYDDTCYVPRAPQYKHTHFSIFLLFKWVLAECVAFRNYSEIKSGRCVFAGWRQCLHNPHSPAALAHFAKIIRFLSIHR